MAIAAWSAPFTPPDDGAVLETLPSRPGDPVQRELRSLRAAHLADPRNPANAIALARRYFDRASAEGDPRYIGYAVAALRAWAGAADEPAEMLVVRAQLAQYRHEFEAALRWLDRALREAPGDPEALAWRAAVHMVRAEYDNARRDCRELARVASELLATGCSAYVDATTGRTRAAYDWLGATLARHAGARPTLRLWVRTLLADMAQRLQLLAEAEAHYRAALALGLTDQYLLAAFAEFLLDNGRPREVVDLLSPWERSDMLLLILARAERALGDPAAERHSAALAARYANAARRGDRLHIQDEAWYRLEFRNDARGALALASENWVAQREPRDARLLLESALAAQDLAAARPALEWLAVSRHEDPRIAALARQLELLAR